MDATCCIFLCLKAKIKQVICVTKRVVIAYFLYAVLTVAVVFQTLQTGKTEVGKADFHNNTRYINVGQTRGMIYDRNMKPLVNREFHTMLVVNPTEEAMSVLKEELTAGDYEKIRLKAEYGNPFMFVCDYYGGWCDDIITTIVYERYSASDVATHLIGYLDSEGNGVCGAEKSYESLLDEYSGSFGIRYVADANGKMLGGTEIETVSSGYASEGGIVQTIDYEIQRVCENVMKNNNMQTGAVVVLDAESSEILALASAPAFDRNNLSESLINENKPFINRALSAYPVGSVFKPIVAATALENGMHTDFLCECGGNLNVSGVVFNCHKRTGHGVLDMTDAMAVSCNMYYIELGLDLGAEKIVSTAESLGFGRGIDLCDGISSSAGNLPSADDIDSSASLANLSFGQGELLATPLQIAAAYGAFLNDGYYTQPYLFRGTVNADGVFMLSEKTSQPEKVLTDSVCERIRKMLLYTVECGSGALASAMVGEVSGKTATAETGKTENGEKTVHTWFAGNFSYKENNYIIVVFRENGNSSSTDCAPVFRDIADGLSGEK